jgi:hypothetical protein
MLKDVIRKWWRVELSFADKVGQIPTAGGRPIPPQNDFCRLSLFCMEGNTALHHLGEGAAGQVQDNKKVRRCLFHECHLGFQIVGAPLYLDGE